MQRTQNTILAYQGSTSRHVETPLATSLPEDNNGRWMHFKRPENVNIHLCGTYLQFTKMKTDTSSYGSDEVFHQFPDLSGKSIQNIPDQRRQLFIKHRLVYQGNQYNNILIRFSFQHSNTIVLRNLVTNLFKLRFAYID